MRLLFSIIIFTLFAVLLALLTVSCALSEIEEKGVSYHPQNAPSGWEQRTFN